MLDTLKRTIDPNPLNEVMSDFSTLYTAGHFAEGEGFSETNNDGKKRRNILKILCDWHIHKEIKSLILVYLR